MNRSVLAISGSLRAVSSSTSLLQAAAALAPAGVEVVIYGKLAELPPFNPDVEELAPPSIVLELRAAVAAADGLLIASPEYAHGVPGVLKNALDWLVGGTDFHGKRIALWNPSPRSTFAMASLRETLTTMAGDVVADASRSFELGGRKDAAAIAADPELSRSIQAALAALLG